MDIARLLLITLLSAIVLACIIGVAVGKYQVKKAAGQLRPLLTTRERIIYAASATIGVICLLVGIFYQPRPPVHEGNMEWAMDPPFSDGEFMQMDPGVREVPPYHADFDDVGHEPVYGDGTGEAAYGEPPYENGEALSEEADPIADQPALEDPANWEEARPAPTPVRPTTPPATRPRPAPGGGGGGVVIIR